MNVYTVLNKMNVTNSCLLLFRLLLKYIYDMVPSIFVSSNKIMFQVCPLDQFQNF